MEGLQKIFHPTWETTESLQNIPFLYFRNANYIVLGVVYTMDREVVWRPCKTRDWSFNSSQDYFGLHKGKKCQSDHEVRGPQ